MGGDSWFSCLAIRVALRRVRGLLSPPDVGGTTVISTTWGTTGSSDSFSDVFVFFLTGSDLRRIIIGD